MRDIVNLSSGTEIFLGRPAKPMDKSISDALSAVVSSVKGITEAYIPQCFIPNVTSKSGEQVLMVILEQNGDPSQVINTIGESIHSKMPSGYDILVIPLRVTDPLVETIRATECIIFRRAESARKWWELWK
jgi:hypothetical protein